MQIPLFTINLEERLSCEMSLGISVFSASLRHRCPHGCSCIVPDFYPFSPFRTANINALCPVFPHRYADSNVIIIQTQAAGWFLRDGRRQMFWIKK